MSTVMEQTNGKVKRAEEKERLGPAKSPPHFEKGITWVGDLTTGMSLLMADTLAERVSTSVANSVCNQAGKMLKAVEMQERYGKTTKSGSKELRLLK